MRHPERTDCCRSFSEAQMNGTDNEGWGALLSKSLTTNDWEIGIELPPIVFCPWCGERIKPETNP